MSESGLSLSGSSSTTCSGGRRGPWRLAGMDVRALCVDPGREVYHASVDDAGDLAIKYWDVSRLGAFNGANAVQAFNELRLRLSTLGSCPDFVPALRATVSREGGLVVYYPYGGRSLDVVCAELREACDKQGLAALLTRMTAEAVLALQKFSSSKPKPLVHRDMKLDNIMLGDDGKIRVADMGCMCEKGAYNVMCDMRYFPPDYAAILPNGRHVYEDPGNLSAANCWCLDARGIGMAIVAGWSGCTLDDIARREGDNEAERIRRIAVLDWNAVIDDLIPDCQPLNALAKFLLTTKFRLDTPQWDSVLRHDTIKPIMRSVLATNRRTHKAWRERVAASSAALWRVEAALLQAELHIMRLEAAEAAAGDAPGANRQPLLLGDKFQVLHEQHLRQQLRLLAAGSAAVDGSSEGLSSANSLASEPQGADGVALSCLSAGRGSAPCSGSGMSSSSSTSTGSGSSSKEFSGSKDVNSASVEAASGGGSCGRGSTPCAPADSSEPTSESAGAGSTPARATKLSQVASLRSQLAEVQATAAAQQAELERLRLQLLQACGRGSRQPISATGEEAPTLQPELDGSSSCHTRSCSKLCKALVSRGVQAAADAPQDTALSARSPSSGSKQLSCTSLRQLLAAVPLPLSDAARHPPPAFQAGDAVLASSNLSTQHSPACMQASDAACVDVEVFVVLQPAATALLAAALKAEPHCDGDCGSKDASAGSEDDAAAASCRSSAGGPAFKANHRMARWGVAAAAAAAAASMLWLYRRR